MLRVPLQRLLLCRAQTTEEICDLVVQGRFDIGDFIVRNRPTSDEIQPVHHATSLLVQCLRNASLEPPHVVALPFSDGLCIHVLNVLIDLRPVMIKDLCLLFIEEDTELGIGDIMGIYVSDLGQFLLDATQDVLVDALDPLRVLIGELDIGDEIIEFSEAQRPVASEDVIP